MVTQMRHSLSEMVLVSGLRILFEYYKFSLGIKYFSERMPQTEVLLLSSDSSRLTWHAGLIHPEKMRKIPFPYLHRVCVWKGEPNFFQVGLGYKTTVYCVCLVRMAIPAFNKNPFSTSKTLPSRLFPLIMLLCKGQKKSDVKYIFHPFGAKQFQAILRQMALIFLRAMAGWPIYPSKGPKIW